MNYDQFLKNISADIKEALEPEFGPLTHSDSHNESCRYLTCSPASKSTPVISVILRSLYLRVLI